MKTGLLRNRVQILPGLGCCDLNQFTSHASGTPLTADRKISLGAVEAPRRTAACNAIPVA